MVNKSGYADMLRHDDTPEADARFQNVQELVASMDEFEREHPEASLADFLENVTLQTSADEQTGGDRVTLMTVHAAKGLEFPVVMVTGLEEQVFPFKGIDPWEDPDELEEERRLAYVAFTRAEQRLVLSFRRPCAAGGTSPRVPRWCWAAPSSGRRRRPVRSRPRGTAADRNPRQ